METMTTDKCLEQIKEAAKKRDEMIDRAAEKYYNEGYDLDREKSTDRLLVFVKSEEVKEED